MKLTALAIFGLWALMMGMGIYGYGLGALWSGLFQVSEPESLIVAWLLAVGMPLSSLGMYLYSRRHPD